MFGSLAVGKLIIGCKEWREGRNILDPLTWVDITRTFLLQVTQHPCTQFRFSFWLAKDLWVGIGTV